MCKRTPDKSNTITTLFNNAPKESDDYDVEAAILDTQVRSKGVNNIAVVAPYGAGKSSAIATYLKRYRKKGLRKPKHVQISLADFNVGGGKEEKDNENAIEQSILQQLLYTQKKSKLPNSNVQRTNKTCPLVCVLNIIFGVLFLFASVTLIFEISGFGLFVRLIGYKVFIKPLAVCGVFVSLLFFIISLIKSGKLKKVKYKEFEVSIDKTGKKTEESLINKFIDEVLYFFQCINVDLVIFEDLDRFNSLKIFVKLKELNTIINNSPKKAKKVTFIYAVRDGMFSDENQRAKFFEFILPVIPVINPNTTEDNIRKMSDKLDSDGDSLKLSEQFIKDISYFVSDMRVLQNTFNDYVITAKKLSDNDEKKLPVKKENLFALELYKNLYPDDYSRLLRNDGLIPLCVNKDRAAKYFTQDLKDKIAKLEEKKEKIEKEMLKSFEELKLMFKGQHYNMPSNYFRGTVPDVNSIESFENITKLAHPQNSNYYVQLQPLPSGEMYFEREQLIKGKGKKQIQTMEEEISTLRRELNDIENSHFHVLISQMGIDKYFSEERKAEIVEKYTRMIDKERLNGSNKGSKISDKVVEAQIGFIQMLIHKNYIDEFYLDYISGYKSELSENDKDFIRSVKRGYRKSCNYRLDNVRKVISELNEDDFSHPEIVINDICKSLDIIREVDNENDVKTRKYDRLMALFTSENETVAKATLEFISVANEDERTKFAKHIVCNATAFVEILYRAALSYHDRHIFATTMIAEKKTVAGMPEVKQFICNHESYMSLFEGIDSKSVCKYIADEQICFERIDVSEWKNRVYEFIVQNNYYVLNIENLIAILNIEDENREAFDRENYSFILKCSNENLKKRVKEEINTYIEKVFIKLPQSREAEEIIIELLTNTEVTEENKRRIITHTDFILKDLNSVAEVFYEQLSEEAKMASKWHNIAEEYKVLGLGEPLINFIKKVKGKIGGSFSHDIDENLQVKLFDKILDTPFEDIILKEIAKSIDKKFRMTGIYGKNERISAFILAGCFLFDVNDMQFLINPPSTIPYLIYHQKSIKANMQTFFANRRFKPLTVKNIIEGQRISLDFKKKFLYLYGSNCSIEGMEEAIAKAIVYNNCEIPEVFLYKFIGVKLDADIKLSLLELTIKGYGISDLVNYRKYFCSINEEYEKFWGESKKLWLENNIVNRIIVEFMKKQGLITSHITKNNKIHIQSA